jgi:hypothetical protein
MLHGKLVPLGGRLISIFSSLNSIRVYMISFCKLLIGVSLISIHVYMISFYKLLIGVINRIDILCVCENLWEIRISGNNI